MSTGKEKHNAGIMHAFVLGRIAEQWQSTLLFAFTHKLKILEMLFPACLDYALIGCQDERRLEVSIALAMEWKVETLIMTSAWDRDSLAFSTSLSFCAVFTDSRRFTMP